MTPTKILFGQLLISISIAIAMIWCATQWTAHALGYSARLGYPLVSVIGYDIYRPWELFIWWYQFEAYAPAIFFKGGLIAASGGLLGMAAAVAGSINRAKLPDEVDTYGSAKWASDQQLRQSGLLAGKGVIIGEYRQGDNQTGNPANNRTKKSASKLTYLRHDGPEHILGFAPTRSGKGVGLVIPTLLSWTGSVLVHDIKGENWQLTAGWRSKFSRTLCFDPTSMASAKFNPLMEIRQGLNEVRDTQNIIDIMIDPQGTGKDLSHWDKTSNDLMIAVFLHVLYAEDDKTMWGISKFMSNPARSFDEILDVMKTTNHLGDRPHEVIAHGAQQASNMSPNEFSGVLSTAMTLLGLYRDPIVNEVTRISDFTIDELVNGACPMSLYLVVPPSDIARTRPLMRLMLNQILCRLTERLDVSNPDAHRLLLMLDEFPALGRLDFFETALGFIAGYGIKAFLIAQSLNQIEKVYGPVNSILDNCHLRITFATNDDRTAKRISEMLGTSTQQRSQRNFTGHRLGLWLGHMMVSTQETSRSLLTPGEIMQLPSEEALIMMAGTPPIRARKTRYYKQAHFTKRLIAAPALHDGFSTGRQFKGNANCSGSLRSPIAPNPQNGADETDIAHTNTLDVEKGTPAVSSSPDTPKKIPEKQRGLNNPLQAQYLLSLEDDIASDFGGRRG